MFKDLTISQYFSKIASKSSIPSGGSVLALVNEASASLLLMVIEFTLNKKGYEKYHDELEDLKKQIESLKNKCHDYIDEDSIVFSSLMDALKSKDQERIKISSWNAIKLSMDLCEISIHLMNQSTYLMNHGNKNLISDVKIAHDLALSTIEGSIDQIKINSKQLEENKKVIVQTFLEEIKGRYEDE